MVTRNKSIFEKYSVTEMKEQTLNTDVGRQAFGADPIGYHLARPAYPEWIYDILQSRCQLQSNKKIFEIGSGSGIATKRLLELGANPLIAIEPDTRFVSFLKKHISHPALQIVASPFEEAKLAKAQFDIGVSATAFHWLNEELSLSKIAETLRPGGWWTMFWNDFGDPGRPDPFHDATKDLLAGFRSPSQGNGITPFSIDKTARFAALQKSGAFENIEHETESWTLTLNTNETIALYSTFSNINIRPDFEFVLKELRRIADNEFNGSVKRNMITSFYSARRNITM